MAEETQLSTRESRLAEAKSLVAAGHTQDQAAAITGIPQRTISRHYRAWMDANPAAKDALEQEIIARSVAIAHQCQDILLERLHDPERAKKLSAMEINAIGGTWADKLSRYRKWGSSTVLDLGGASDTLGSLMNRLQSASITMTARDGSETTVTVENTQAPQGENSG